MFALIVIMTESLLKPMNPEYTETYLLLMYIIMFTNKVLLPKASYLFPLSPKHIVLIS